MTTKEKENLEAIDTLFNENSADVNKNQDYKKEFKYYSLPSKYYLIEMYNKQKELQSFLAGKNKTQKFPMFISEVRQPDVQLAIYHLFCMQIEGQELKVEIDKLINQDETDNISARYELIDMFFFMFNVGIYTGLDIERVLNLVQSDIDNLFKEGQPIDYDMADIQQSFINLMNYIDKLPWKAWKDYDYNTFFINKLNLDQCYSYYAKAIFGLIKWSKNALSEDLTSLFNLYMNKWEENKRRQEDLNSGYVLVENKNEIPTGFPGDMLEAFDNN